ncbi:MAG TPA: transcription termination factor NusA, partial [Candidatus Sabulitectum sp.]|nr:transcription termination factor NusA [Candidatus Sabulitectum sp.]
MTDFERIEALAGLVREKGVNREVLLKSLHAGLVKASLREYGEEQDIKVTWDQGSGDIRMEAMKTVVEKPGRHRTHMEIDLKNARKIEPDCEIGDSIAVPVSITDFGRSAVNEFRSEFMLLVKSAERNQVWKEYNDRIGMIIPRCRVQQVYRNRILVQVAGKIEAVVPADERARGERYEQGDSITPVLIRVEKPESLEPQLVLSRATPELVRRLFEREAPEIEEGVVQIKTIAREAGVRSKIAVASTDMRIDAVGAFVGMKGTRVQSVMRELNGERIDILPWTRDRIVLASQALAPATVLHMEAGESFNRETGEM